MKVILFRTRHTEVPREKALESSGVAKGSGKFTTKRFVERGKWPQKRNFSEGDRLKLTSNLTVLLIAKFRFFTFSNGRDPVTAQNFIYRLKR